MDDQNKDEQQQAMPAGGDAGQGGDMGATPAPVEGGDAGTTEAGAAPAGGEEPKPAEGDAPAV